MTLFKSIQIKKPGVECDMRLGRYDIIPLDKSVM